MENAQMMLTPIKPARFGFVGLWLLLFGCSTAGQEPVYGGRPLSEWAVMTTDEDIGGGPSARAREAAQVVRAIGPAKAIPFLLRWIQPPWKDSRMPGGAERCFQLFGLEAKAAIPGLAKILNRPAKTLKI